MSKLTRKQAWKIINKAAHEIENETLDASPSIIRGALRKLSGDLRRNLESLIGPQPGYGPRRTVPKPGVDSEELPGDPGSRILDPEEEMRWGRKVSRVMDIIKTCAICNYQTNVRGDMADHKKERHS